MMGEWSVSQWKLGVMGFQKIFGLYSEERHKVEKWSGQVGSGWVMGKWTAGQWIVS